MPRPSVRRGKSGIKKQPPRGERELRIPLKEKTARNILALNNLVGQKMGELQEAQVNLQNHILPICTERGVPEGARIVQVTEKAPWELVLKVPK